MNHSIIIEVVEEERPGYLFCRVEGKLMWLPKSAVRPVIDGERCTDGRGPVVGECDVRAEIPMELAREKGLIPMGMAPPVYQQCRTCGAPIVWAKTVNNKSIPVDAEPCEYGGNMVLRDGVAVVLKKDEPSLPDEKRYRSHFATCGQAAHHRKPASTDAAKTKAGKRAKPPAPKEEPNLFGSE